METVTNMGNEVPENVVNTFNKDVVRINDTIKKFTEYDKGYNAGFMAGVKALESEKQSAYDSGFKKSSECIKNEDINELLIHSEYSYELALARQKAEMLERQYVALNSLYQYLSVNKCITLPVSAEQYFKLELSNLEFDYIEALDIESELKDEYNNKYMMNGGIEDGTK